ncbi:hypothetical protein M0R45_006387 [Rubus argutus]|uniref:Uncharacterized protein n=1 Tax=Rubus argutus TaxID=59490 RepID=A0AAW1YQT4_RUBAR
MSICDAGVTISHLRREGPRPAPALGFSSSIPADRYPPASSIHTINLRCCSLDTGVALSRQLQLSLLHGLGKNLHWKAKNKDARARNRMKKEDDETEEKTRKIEHDLMESE